MVTATARTPVQDTKTRQAAVETVQRFDAELMGEKIPCETTIGVGAEPAATGEAPRVEQTGGMQVTTTTTGASVPAVASRYADDSFQGDWDESDVSFPVLAIVQGSTGRLVEAGHPQGALVLGDDELLPAPSPKVQVPPLRFIPMQVQKSYRENVSQEEYQAGQMPRIARSKEEVLELGGTLAWGPNGEKPNWGASARCVFLIEAPENTEHPGFGIELDGKMYAVGVYYAKNAAYKTTAAVLFNIYQTVLFVPRLGPDNQPIKIPGKNAFQKDHLLYKRVWNWTWAQKTSGNFKPWIPKVTLTAQDTSPAVREFIAGLVSPAESVADD
jgi:hypothetical protein